MFGDARERKFAIRQRCHTTSSTSYLFYLIRVDLVAADIQGGDQPVPDGNVA